MAAIRPMALVVALVLTGVVVTRVAGAADSSGFALTVSGGKLSLEASDASLPAILEAIAERTGVRVLFDERTQAKPPDEPVTVELHEVPVEEALRLLLRGRDIVFVYAPGRLAEARVYGASEKRPAPSPQPAAGVRSTPGNAPPSSPAPAANAAPDANLAPGVNQPPAANQPPDAATLARWRTDALENPDPTVRWRALEALAATGDRERLRETAVAMLEHESDPALLQRVLDLMETDHTIPIEPLVKLARANSSPEVRLKALAHLGADVARDPRARQTLEALAAADPASNVRDAARALLQQPAPR
jgi:hypothetical protein